MLQKASLRLSSVQQQQQHTVYTLHILFGDNCQWGTCKPLRKSVKPGAKYVGARALELEYVLYNVRKLHGEREF